MECVKCILNICIWLGRCWGDSIRGLGLGFINPVGTGGVLDVCLCCGGVGGEWVGRLTRVWMDELVLCMCEL